MEISILKQIKNKATRLLETQLLRTGQVLDVRAWESSGLIEIELHLPNVDMRDWMDVPYIKCRVDDFTFRDYTPFGWDAETATCSVLIDADHQGPGSRWAKSLIKGDTIFYLRPESTRQSPHPTDCIVGLGDVSSIGHLLALQQLTVPVSRFYSAIVTSNPDTGQLLTDNFSPAMLTIPTLEELSAWLLNQGYCKAHTWFYLIGNQQMIISLRRLLKDMGHSHIRVKGFWS